MSEADVDTYVRDVFDKYLVDFATETTVLRYVRAHKGLKKQFKMLLSTVGM
jgi:hypothetical protein